MCQPCTARTKQTPGFNCRVCFEMDKKEKDVFYKRLTICTCDDNPYSDRCDWCLAKDGISIDT